MPAFILNEGHAKRGARESHEQDDSLFALATTRWPCAGTPPRNNGAHALGILVFFKWEVGT